MTRSYSSAVYTDKVATKYALPFLVGCALLDGNFGASEVKIGNLIITFGAILSILLVANTEKDRATFDLRMPDIVYFIYLFYAALTAIWSPSPLDSLVQIAFLTIIWGATVALRNMPLITMVRYQVAICVVIAVLSLISIFISYRYSFQETATGNFLELRGVLNHQLRLGLYEGLALGLIFITCLNGDRKLLFKSRISLIVVFLLLFVTTVMAYARLYSFALILSLIISPILSRPGKSRYLGALLLALGAALILYTSEQIVDQLEDIGFDTGLTGRTLIWKRALQLAEDAPILGHGFASFSNPMFDWIFTGEYRPPHAHNSYIQAYFETGIIGLTLTIIFILSQFISLFRNGMQTKRISYGIFMVVFSILGSLTGAVYAWKPTSLLALTMLVVSIELRRRPDAVRQFNHPTALSW